MPLTIAHNCVLYFVIFMYVFLSQLTRAQSDYLIKAFSEARIHCFYLFYITVK